jgi:hypothetical protein
MEFPPPPARYRGRDQAQGGRIMGMVGTGLLVLGVLALIALLVFAVAVVDTTGLPEPIETTNPGSL